MLATNFLHFNYLCKGARCITCAYTAYFPIIFLISFYMITTLLILFVSAVFFAIGKIRSDLVALCALAALLVFGILTPQEALSGFSNSVVIMMVGLFVVGGAIFQTGLAKKASSTIMSFAGSNELLLFLLIIVVTAVIGAFVSNTGTVALMMPIVVSLAQKANIKARSLLMSLAFASSMGGMLTLIGTPPNLVIQDALIESGHQPLSFFTFLPVGVVCIIVGIVVMLPLSKWLLSGSKTNTSAKASKKRKSLDDLIEEYRLKENLSVFRVNAGSDVVGKTLGALDIHRVYGITVLEVRRRTGKHSRLLQEVEQNLAGPETTLEADDTIYLSGDKESARAFAAKYNLTTIADDLAFYDIGIAEIILMPQSNLSGKQLKDAGLRKMYNVNVLGIRRDGEYITENIPQFRMQAGDVLLIQGKWKNIARLSGNSENLVVIGQPHEDAAAVTLDYKAPLAAVIMLAMIALMVFDFIPIAPVTAVILGGIAMVLTGCIRSVDAAYKTINWESIVLIAAMMPMATALEKTGVSNLVASALVSNLGTASPYALLAGIYFTTSLLTMFISNTATAVLMAPIALGAATTMGISPYPMLFAVTLGASMCFASPFSTPPNALVMQAGGYSFMDYVKVGVPLQVIMGLVMIVVLPLLFPF